MPRPVLVRWLLEVTRPALLPLLGSAACRVTGHLAGVSLFCLGAWAVARTGTELVSGARGTESPGLAAVVVAMLVLALVKAALRYGEQLLGHLVAFRALELLRAEVFASLVPRSPRIPTTSRSGDLLARATKDVDRIEVLFAHTLAPVACAALVPPAVLLAVGATTSWPTALAALPLLAAQLLVVPRLGAATSLEASRAAAAQRARLTHHVKDTVQGMSEVVGYGRGQERLDQMRHLDVTLSSLLRPSSTWASLRRGTNQVLSLLAPVAVVAAGADGVRSGSVSLPALVAAAAAVLRLSESVRAVEDLAGSITTSYASAERVWEVVNAPVEAADGTEEPITGISHEVLWQDVSYSYPSSATEALSEVSLRARAGQWTCVVGASGSGKSTLAMLTLRRDEPSSGQVLLDGTDIRRLRAESLYQEVALVPQQVLLFRASVADNVRLAAPSASNEEVRQACRAAGVDEEVEALPQGYATVVGERGESLSGGQRQRIALARALLTRPNLLVLDEFTSHLDPETEARVRQGVRHYLPDATVIEITHRLQWSTQADHVVVLDAGRVVQEGRPAALLEADGPLRTLSARSAEPGRGSRAASPPGSP